MSIVPRDCARLFLALWPSPTVRGALLDSRDTWTWPAPVSLVERERLHLTLHFLGDVSRERIPKLTSELTLPFHRFALNFGQPQVWPGDVAVLQPDSVPPELLQLHASLGKALQRFLVPVDARAFRPHVTLARNANGAAPPEQGPHVRRHVHGYALVESQTAPAHSYTVLKRYR